MAYLGTPASELSLIMATDEQVVIGAAYGRQALTPGELQRLSAWLSASWWRHLWRRGHQEAACAEAINEAGIYARCLPWLPEDWARDFNVATTEALDR